MLRENKFRGISVYTNKFVYGGLVRCNSEGRNGLAIKDTMYNINNGKVNLIPEVVIPETVGQFTELKDKNGKEIYEGDIVSHKMPDEPYNTGKTIIGIIEFVEELASFRTVTENGDEEPIHPDIFLEVVGNIHNNPELLK